ncbi:hypothetical protein A7X68_19060 [Stenotrophomonas maltophilia]|uniref:hypothetical protein n=1 Tax=Stenotrophomonas maltophilia TaxID=40324 RepID=UPI000DA961F3|nr:hypothetical protein [Stenotrophomonas maltophilia]PZS73226.1 hypothetical protein A7X68_19060 [Stenotrophomonas maltophilia]
MTGTLAALALVAGALSFSIGCAKLVSWLLDRRDYTALQQSREAVFVAQARAELAATGWTPDHETLYQAEIAATKRGDLLAAARYAQDQERAA